MKGKGGPLAQIGMATGELACCPHVPVGPCQDLSLRAFIFWVFSGPSWVLDCHETWTEPAAVELFYP